MTPPLQATSAPTWLDRGRIPSLDGLRGVAILLVLATHSRITTGFPPVGSFVDHILHSGRLGVDLFFVISGFLITTLMLREFDRSGFINVRQFYVRRFLRIVPAYAIFLLLLAMLQVAGLTALTNRDWMSALTYTVNFHSPSWELGHVWSLSIEEHFYLLWPILVAFYKPSSIVTMSLAAIVSCFTIRSGLYLAGVGGFAKWTFSRLDVIAMGCLLAGLVRQRTWRTRLDRCCRTPWAVPLLLSMLVSLQAMALLSYRFRIALLFPLRAAVLSLLLWTVIIRERGITNRLLNNRVLVEMGILSYSLYLWQQMFLYPHATGWLRLFPLNIACACLAAFASYRLVETPFLRLKQRYSSSAKSHEPRLQMEQMARETPS